jgi:hypothetical protein
MTNYPDLHHYSKSVVARVVSRTQQIDDYFKPIGFWVSDDIDGEGWANWCRGEDFNLGSLAFRRLVRIAPDANLLWLKSIECIDEFTERFERSEARPFSYNHIDWPAVAREYQGILITPYQWERRLSDHSRWYYSWDCASGCIWDAEAVASIALANEQVAA